ncbi:MAG: hypothetical protein WBG88_00105 [Mesorhizobium sp.]
MPVPDSERQRTERLLHEMLDKAHAAEKAVEESRKSLLSGLFSPGRDGATGDDPKNRQRANPSQPQWPRPPQAQFPRPETRTGRRSDLVLAALGVALGLICALFPWYIFYNDIRFTTHGLYVGGTGGRGGRIVNPNPAAGGIAPETAQDGLPQSLDLFATGTPAEEREDPAKAPGLDQQPFPADTSFRLVHVANGRAMIEDDAGLWIVQPGSTLPDNSKVATIERRGGKWVLVTSTNTVIEPTR